MSKKSAADFDVFQSETVSDESANSVWPFYCLRLDLWNPTSKKMPTCHSVTTSMKTVLCCRHDHYKAFVRYAGHL